MYKCTAALGGQRSEASDLGVIGNCEMPDVMLGMELQKVQ